VIARLIIPILVPPGGTALPAAVPDDPLFCGIYIYLQAVELQVESGGGGDCSCWTMLYSPGLMLFLGAGPGA
jgi:hypothetical protein